MFEFIGRAVYRLRYATIAVVVVFMAGLGAFGLDLDSRLSQSGWFDPGSESVAGSVIADQAHGRDKRADVIVLFTPPEGTGGGTTNTEWRAQMNRFVTDLIASHADEIDQTAVINSLEPGADLIRSRTQSSDNQRIFVSLGLNGADDTAVLKNFNEIKPAFTDVGERYGAPGTKVELAGLQPVASAMSDGMAEDIKRAELIAMPLVLIMLFIIFGGAVAASLPVFIGGLTIAGSLGLMKLLTYVTDLNVFARSVVTLIGLGIAIDYGLFIVSRFREEMAEGRSTPDAVRRTVMTAGQTVVFSATIIVAALASLLLFPQGFLKSVAFGAIASVGLAAAISITVLPAILGILGPRIDSLGFSFLRRTRTRQEVESGFWGRLADWVMRHPLKTAIPTIALLLLLIIPFGGIQFGGITEKYLPPNDSTRVAQEDFDRYFPRERTEAVKIVFADVDVDDDDQSTRIAEFIQSANEIPGFTGSFTDTAAYVDGKPEGGVRQLSAGLIDRSTAGEAVKKLRDIPDAGLHVYIAGTPALEQDSITALLADLPWMTLLLLTTTFVLMFLAFGSVVLPIKAALVSALGLASTLGILTWIFIDGHGSSIADFTPGPLMSAVLVLIIAIIFGLSTDYEIFLISRMVEARQQGATTAESIRTGTAMTGRIITAAAAILVVVTGAFGLSEIVMMKYIAFGMIAALILDATIIRMLLVPAIMKLLDDDCWWAPQWSRRLQERIGLGETVLDDGPGALAPVGAVAPVGAFVGGDSAAPTGPAGPRVGDAAPPGPRVDSAAEATTVLPLTPPVVPGESSVPPGRMPPGRPGPAPYGGSRRPDPNRPGGPNRPSGPNRPVELNKPGAQTRLGDPNRRPAGPPPADRRGHPDDRRRPGPDDRRPGPVPDDRRRGPAPADAPRPGTAPRPDSQRGSWQTTPSKQDQLRLAAQRRRERDRSGPDTGGWHLGSGGITLEPTNSLRDQQRLDADRQRLDAPADQPVRGASPRPAPVDPAARPEWADAPETPRPTDAPASKAADTPTSKEAGAPAASSSPATAEPDPIPGPEDDVQSIGRWPRLDETVDGKRRRGRSDAQVSVDDLLRRRGDTEA